MTQHLLEQAIRWQAAGIVALPVRSDGSKAPGLATWKEYQQRRPSIDELVQWFGHGAQGIGVLTGAISGHLEMVELEGRAILGGALARLKEHAADHDALGLLDKVIDGYCEQTPSVGIHLLYRLEGGGVRRNTKLARTADRQVLAETRGEGGFVVVAPSAGTTHPTGAAWTIISGSIEQVATITLDERDLLWAIIRMLDEEPEREAATEHAIGGMLAGSIAGTRPGDDYNERADWSDILAGWTRATRMGSGYGWRKPGKQGPGISATTGQSADGVDRLYVFSTSTEFEPERPYTKFAAYALLEHRGDYGAAAKALAAAGYGSQPQQSTVAVAEPPGIAGSSAPSATAIATLTDQAASTVARTEDGHSQALIAEYGREIKYCSERGRWLHWNGSIWCWQAPGGGIVRELAKAVARSYPSGDGWDAFKKRALSSSGIAACLTLSETDYRVAVSIHELDARPWELNTPGGILDLRSGELRDSNPASLHTKSTACTPDPQADKGAWLAFLADTFGDDEEMIGWLQRLFGYTCVGEVREAILPLFFGLGANGKTTILETIAGLLADYATEAPQGFLIQGPPQHPAEIAELAGARFVIASETNEDQKFDEAKVKQLTGGDRLKGRFMRQDWFGFAPSHTLFLMTNHRPEVRSGGHGFWRRVREVPFTREVPPDKKIEKYHDILIRDHGPAIMSWLAIGASQYASEGLKDPSGVRAATSEYQASTDTVTRFVGEMCIVGGGDHVKTNSSTVRRSYEQWCEQEGETAISAKAMTMQLAAKFGIGKTRDTRHRFLTNVSLISGAEEEK